MKTYTDGADGHEPELKIEESFPDVRPLEVGIVDTSLVFGDVLEEGRLLSIGEELSLHRRVGKDEEGRDTNQASRAANKDEHGLP